MVTDVDCPPDRVYSMYPGFKTRIPQGHDREYGWDAYEITCLICGWNRNEYQTDLVAAAAKHLAEHDPPGLRS